MIRCSILKFTSRNGGFTAPNPGRSSALLFTPLNVFISKYFLLFFFLKKTRLFFVSFWGSHPRSYNLPLQSSFIKSSAMWKTEKRMLGRWFFFIKPLSWSLLLLLSKWLFVSPKLRLPTISSFFFSFLIFIFIFNFRLFWDWD